MVGTGSVASVASATASLTSLWFQTPDGLVLWFSISRIYSPHPAPAPTCANSSSGLDGGALRKLSWGYLGTTYFAHQKGNFFPHCKVGEGLRG